jgi:hypothetical protein
MALQRKTLYRIVLIVLGVLVLPCLLVQVPRLIRLARRETRIARANAGMARDNLKTKIDALESDLRSCAAPPADSPLSSGAAPAARPQPTVTSALLSDRNLNALLVTAAFAGSLSLLALLRVSFRMLLWPLTLLARGIARLARSLTYLFVERPPFLPHPAMPRPQSRKMP